MATEVTKYCVCAWQPEDEELSELSDMDEEEAGLYLHTKEESKLKEVIWTELNKEYLEKASAKQAAQEAAQAKVGSTPWRAPLGVRGLPCMGCPLWRHLSTSSGGCAAQGGIATACTPP